MYAYTSYGSAVPVTKHDTNPNHYAALIVTVTGNLVVTPQNGGADITFTGLPCGALIPFEVALVKSTGSTASVAGLA
jgi:hypothetical protein